MSALWSWIVLAGLAAFLLKVIGFLLPRRMLEHPVLIDIAATMTVGLLSALVMVSAFASDTRLAVDARAGALLAAVVALRLRAPFLVVVVVGAAAAALVRLAEVG